MFRDRLERAVADGGEHDFCGFTSGETLVWAKGAVCVAFDYSFFYKEIDCFFVFCVFYVWKVYFWGRENDLAPEMFYEHFYKGSSVDGAVWVYFPVDFWF